MLPIGLIICIASGQVELSGGMLQAGSVTPLKEVIFVQEGRGRVMAETVPEWASLQSFLLRRASVGTALEVQLGGSFPLSPAGDAYLEVVFSKVNSSMSEPAAMFWRMAGSLPDNRLAKWIKNGKAALWREKSGLSSLAVQVKGSKLLFPIAWQGSRDWRVSFISLHWFPSNVSAELCPGSAMESNVGSWSAPSTDLMSEVPSFFSAAQDDL